MEIRRGDVERAWQDINRYRCDGCDRIALIYGDRVERDDRLEPRACLIVNAVIAYVCQG